MSGLTNSRTRNGRNGATTPITSSGPVVSPYRSTHQLVSLGSRLQLPKPSSQTLAEVQVLQLRGKLPHAVECTALFASLRLADVPGANTFILRNAYALALVRFVNGMLDPFQQGQYASALVNIAKTVGLPLSFVEIRHAATHDELPTLEALRALALDAREWLQEIYWLELSLEDVGGEAFDWDSRQVAGPSDTRDLVVRWLKIYKRGRKRLLDTEVLVRPAKCDSEQQILWTAIDNLMGECNSNSTQVADILVRHFLVKKVEAKTKTAIKVYIPLVEILGCGFRWNVVLALIQQSSPLVQGHFEDNSLAQVEQWLQQLIPLVLQGPFSKGSDGANHEFLEHHVGSRSDAVEVLKTNLTLLDADSSVRKAAEELLVGPVKKRFAVPPLLEEILSEQKGEENVSEQTSAEPEEREEKGDWGSKRRRKISLFASQDNWTVKPFGVA